MLIFKVMGKPRKFDVFLLKICITRVQYKKKVGGSKKFFQSIKKLVQYVKKVIFFHQYY